MFFHQQPRGTVQLTGPAIIAQPFPMLEHLLLRRRGQRLHVGEALQKSLKIGNHRDDLRLLQHDLADPHAIGIR